MNSYATCIVMKVFKVMSTFLPTDIQQVTLRLRNICHRNTKWIPFAIPDRLDIFTIATEMLFLCP